jgi:hypothetical protein
MLQMPSGAVDWVLALTPICLTFAGVIVAFHQTMTKGLARWNLSKAVRKGGQAERDRLQELVARMDLDGAAALVRTHLSELPKAQRIQAESALSQPSPNGRRSYIVGVGGLE